MKWFNRTVLSGYVVIPFFVTLVTLSLVLIPSIVLKKNPSVDFPIIRIYGEIPHLMKDQITSAFVYPFMNQLRHDVGIKESYIRAYDESVYIALQYYKDVNVEERLWALKTMVSQIQSKVQLPSDTSFQFVQKDIETRIKPFILTLEWREGQERSQQIVHDIVSQIQGVSGVKQVDSSFEPNKVIIELDPIKMAEHQVRLVSVQQAIQQLGVQQVDRMMTQSKMRFVVSYESSLYTVESLHQLPIQTHLNQPLRLADVASIYSDKRQQKSQVTVNQNDSVLIGISLYPNASVPVVSKQIQQLVDQLNQRSEYPRVGVIHNQADQVETFVHNFKWNIILGALLILISLLILTTVKMGLLTAIMLPLTSVISMGILVLCGVQIQQVSLAGFIIALGLMVDNAIVLQEVVDIQPKKWPRAKRIYRAVKQVFPSIAVSTLTTLMAFAPIYFLKSEEGLFLKSLPISIWVNLVVAFVLATTLLPWILYRWPRRWRLRLPSIAPFFHGPFQVHYATLLRYCLQRPYVIAVLILGSLVLTGVMASSIRVELMPEKKEQMFYLNLMNPNQSISIPKAQVAHIESLLKDDPDVVRVISAIGQSVPRLDLSFREISSEPGNAQILVYTVSDAAKKRLINELRPVIPKLPYTPQTLLASLTYAEVFQYPVQVVLNGINHQELLAEANQLKRVFNQWNEVDHALIEGTQGVSSLSFDIDRSFQYAEGVMDQELNGWLQMLLGPISVGELLESEQRLPVRLSLPENNSVQALLDQVVVLNQFGTPVALDQFVVPRFVEQKPSYYFEDFLATVVVLVKPNDQTLLVDLQRKIDEYLSGYQMPPGVQVASDGQLGKQSEVLGSFAVYAIIIVFLMYGVLVIRFRSFKQPFLIYITIPLSFVGSVIGLFISGNPLTFIGILGLTGLTGIVINDGILLVDTANYFRADGMSVKRATIEAAKSRFFPVVLTSVTTIIGLVPLLFSDNMFSQLALTFVWGLFSSTVLLLFVVPVLYRRISDH